MLWCDFKGVYVDTKNIFSVYMDSYHFIINITCKIFDVIKVIMLCICHLINHNSLIFKKN